MDRKKVKLKDHSREAELFNRRLLVSSVLVLALTLLLVFRLCYLQIIEHAIFIAMSEKNQVTLLPLAPNRGLIYDRNGVLIAQNVPVFSLEIIPDKVTDLKTTLAELEKLITLSSEDKEQFYKQLKQHRRFDTIPLKLKLDEEEIARFYLNQYRFKGVLIRARLMRYYPLGPTLVNVVGYVGRINENELAQLDQTNYAATNFIGKLGIENYYEDTLHGEVGYQEVETDASGRIVRVLKRIPPKAGENLYLSIDSKLQIAAEEALGENFGAVVAIKPSTGEVLAMASNPNYDPNLFVKGMSSSEYKALQTMEGKPLYNRTIRGLYPLGSTIKPFLALEALNSHIIDNNFKIRDPGYFSLPNSSHVYRDWKKGGHGTVDVIKAITVSCDTFFYTVGVKMGIMNIDAILHDFGFGKLTGIDLNEELAGLIPSPEWKRRVKHQAWYPGDTVVSSIGQGFMLTTPLQLANGVAIISMRGQGYQPHLLIKSEDETGKISPNKPIPLPVLKADQKYWDMVFQGMQNVVAGGGTAAAISQAPYTIAGKTGTAQVYSTQGREIAKNVPKHLRDNTLFIAFAPVENPQIAIAVIVENSKDAKFVARKVLDSYFGYGKKDESQPHLDA
jgi:penicillin-binding protein 2